MSAKNDNLFFETGASAVIPENINPIDRLCQYNDNL